MSRGKRPWILGLVAAAALLGGVAAGVRLFMAEDPFFSVASIHVDGIPDKSPVSADDIRKMISETVRGKTLFSVDLDSVRGKLLAYNDWIEDVQVQKIFPGSLHFELKFRRPVAVVQTGDGQLRYLDPRGTVFGGGVELDFASDLPVLSGVSLSETEVFRQIVSWLGSWTEKKAELSALHRDRHREWTALVVYPLRGKSEPHRSLARLGREGGRFTVKELTRVQKVFAYLAERALPAEEVRVVGGKKIVVKTGNRF